MFKAIILGMLISTSAFAGHLDKVCENAVKGPVWEDNLISYYDTVEKEFMITTHEGMILTSVPVAIKGVIQDGISIWVLGAMNLVEMNAAGDVLNSYVIEETGGYVNQALSMVKAGNKIIITRGGAGMIGFDLEKREIAWTNSFSGDNDGFPSGVVFNGSKLYVAAATSVEKGFTGIITMDPETGAVEEKTPYDVARWGVLDVDAKARMNGDTLVLNNGGWIHVITKAQIESDKAIRPRWAAHVVPQDGPVNRHYMMINGEFMIHDGHVMGCGLYTAQENGVFVRKSKLFHVKLP